MTDKIRQLKQWIKESNYLIFFGGAGVSTESGIPDFRGKNGLYRQKRKIPLEKILSHDFFMEHPEEYYNFLRSSDHWSDVKPNQAHIRLAELEREGKLKAIITQNADGLHQQAGSRCVYELHGNGNRFFCVRCHKEYPREKIFQEEGVPHCECGGLIRPGAVFFGESLNKDTLLKAIQAIRNADVLIVGGTSLVVYPAAGLIDYYQGKRLVLINENPTPYDSKANLLIADKIGTVFSQV